jgi:hypothetical protein
MPTLQFEPLCSALSPPQSNSAEGDRAVSVLHAANVREQLLKMANEFIDPVNGASLTELRGARDKLH